ncbi:hypothetical protein N7489_010772 [Penicillium chrysogenum]|uniref:uncharacterized protein n=1 Tax=Penicillium chrysogenum TaxID=5076 RepID=UPI0024DF1231|nr:uncharacterized protein N7489_010772 [Penicillium chrysogenum]KAJ5230064.1 hypothetical protein N7489_010772 [Penicillium chrysogenum]
MNRLPQGKKNGGYSQGSSSRWLIEMTGLPIVLKPKPATVRLEVRDRGGLPIVLKPEGPPRSGWKCLIEVLPIVLKPKPATVRLEVGDRAADCPEAEARHGQTGRGLSRWLIGGGDRPADCPEAEARHGQTGRGLSSLPIVLKPKPATVRLEVVYRGGWLTKPAADCPEAEARHGQTGRGLSRWLIGGGDRVGYRGGRSPPRSGWKWLLEGGFDLSGLNWMGEVDWSSCLTSLPIVLKPKPATVRLEVGDQGGRKARHGQTGSGLSRWLIGGGDRPADCPEAEARHGQTRSGLPIVLKPEGPPRSGWKCFIELGEVNCLTSLPIVLKPKPATCLIGWMVDWKIDWIDWRIGWKWRLLTERIDWMIDWVGWIDWIDWRIGWKWRLLMKGLTG